MATIQTSFIITDGMTPALQSMNRAMNIVLNSFEAMQRVSGKAVDTKSIQTARTELAKAQTQFNNIENEIRQNTTAQNQFNSSVRNGTGSAHALWGKLKGIAATYLGFQSVKGIIGLSDTMTTTTARLNMINDGLQTTAELNDKIYQAAMRSRGSLTGTADAVAKLAARAGNMFKSNDETIAFAETLNKMFVIAGASEQEMASATLQLTQALGSGVLRGEEFNAVFEAAPNVMQAVADYMNVPIGKLRELAADGKISAGIVKNALFSAADEVNKKFESMPYTWGQVWTTIKNYTIKALQPILEGIGKLTSNERFIKFASGVGDAISRVASTIKNVFSVLAPVLAGIYDQLADIYNFIIDNWSFIGPVVWGIVAAYTAYHTILLLVKIAEWACVAAKWAMFTITSLLAVAKFLLGMATWAETTATIAATGAQWGLNTALYSCPLVWIILLIIALIVVVYLVVAAVNHFAGTSVSATGVIAGAFMVLYATIYNIIAYLWNYFSAFVEFLVNVFKNPVYSIKKLFVNLATNLLDLCISMTKGWDEMATNFVNAMLDAINGVLEGWNWLVDKLGVVGEKLGLGKATRFEHRTSITSDFENAKGKLQDMLGEEPKDYWNAKKLEYKDVRSNWEKGYNWGAEKENQLSNLFSGKKFKDLTGTDELKKLQDKYGKDNVDKYGNVNKGNGGDKQNDIEKALRGGLGKNPALDGIAKDIGSIADDTDSLSGRSDEELNLMRDLAERDAINRYTMSNLKINMTNNNNVSSGMDLDKISEYLQRKVYEGVVSTAEGVHI